MFQAGIAMNTLAWNNSIGPGVVSVGSRRWVITRGIVGGIRTAKSEVKFLDFCKTD